MKIKYILAAFVCAASALFSGCGKNVVYKNGIAAIENAHITLSVPENWTTLTGDDVYDELYKQLSDEYGSVKELKKSFEDNGEQLLLNSQSPDGGVIVMLSETERGESDAERTLRAVHDTTIFDLRSSGFFTEGEFKEYTWGGVSGMLSRIMVSDAEGEPPAFEEREFCFERNEMLYSLKIHILNGFENELESIELRSDE